MLVQSVLRKEGEEEEEEGSNSQIYMLWKEAAENGKKWQKE